MVRAFVGDSTMTRRSMPRAGWFLALEVLERRGAPRGAGSGWGSASCSGTRPMRVSRVPHTGQVPRTAGRPEAVK